MRGDVDIGDDEMERRQAAWVEPPPVATRGWARLYAEHVSQADTGADLLKLPFPVDPDRVIVMPDGEHAFYDDSMLDLVALA